MGKISQWFQKKVKSPIIAELQQGITVKQLAAATAVSLAIAVNPFIGTTTILCLVFGKIFRLNHVVMQTINYFSYPLQIGLIIPWVRLGERIVGETPQPFELGMLMDEFSHSFVTFLSKFYKLGVHAFLGWIVVAPLVAWGLYRLLIPVFSRLLKKYKSNAL